MFPNNSTFREINSFYISLSLVLFFILPLVTCPLLGQVVQKKQLTAADYSLWGNLDMDKIAPNEKWVSYKMSYENNVDTLFVRSTFNDKTYCFPSAKQSIFTKDNLFVCYSKEDFVIENLETGNKEIITGVVDYSYSFQYNLLFIQLAGKANKNKLIIRFPNGKVISEIPDVSKFSLSPVGNHLIYTISFNNKHSLFLSNLEKVNFAKRLASANENHYDNFTWQKDGRAFGFLSKSNNESIESLFYYILEGDKLFEYDSTRELSFPAGALITDNFFNSIVISDDLQKVFFNIQSRKVPAQNKTDSTVEIWNTNDKWVYPQNQKFGKFDHYPKVLLWKPFSNILEAVSTNDLPSVMLSGKQEYAILSNPKAYEPQFDFEGPRDYYIMNLNTFEKSIFLTRQSGFYLDMIPSPGGKYIAYFKENNWWIYDIISKTHTNITITIGVPFSGKVHALKSDSAFGNPAWTDDEKEILLYDEFDLWAVKPDGSFARRLTRGRESQIKYRIAKIGNKNAYNFMYDGQLLDSYNLEKDIILCAEGEDGKTGFFKWTRNANEKLITYGDSYVDHFSYISKNNNFFYIEQNFNLPPRLIYNKNSSFIKCVFQSNLQHNKFYWGKSELIHFQNSKKQNLKGVLFYPANYKPQKKYPMIVHIYETQSNELHKYCNPTMHNEPGFNAAIFTSLDYFFFMPDIIHENGNVGPSATDCVVEGTKKVIELGLVDSKKIGLVGHSFGGYESAFISNNTNLFATAIASGAITDLKSLFFSIGWNTTKPEMWRFATEQWRLEGKNPLEDPQDFNRNSPLESVINLKIPLLMWCGKEDKTVDWRQSIEYFLALRRLGKKNIMLVYPKEDHTLTNPLNQTDLTERVLQWFGYYLKDEKNIEWINRGMQ